MLTCAAAGTADGEATTAGAALGTGTARPTSVGCTPPGVGAGLAAEDGTGETAGLTAGVAGGVAETVLGTQADSRTVTAANARTYFTAF